jgi:predicted enzyme related to lactoylglutathione lyase
MTEPEQQLRVVYVFAAVVVSDRDRSVAWYERLFGRGPDLLPNDREAAWTLMDGASLYVVVDASRSGPGVVTLIVDDLDARLEAIEARGLTASTVETITGAGRKATIFDPDDNAIALVELEAAP